MLALKILLAPGFVVAVSLAGRRWGPTVAGLLGGFPVVGFPILLVLTLVHGDDFGADAAAASLLGLAAVAAFTVVYARLAARLRPLPTLLSGWVAFFAGIVLLGWLSPPVGISLALAAGAFELGRVLVPAPPGDPAPGVAMPWWDLPARTLAALALVLAITTASEALGPTWSGLLTPFPILTSVLLAFTHLHAGVAETRVLARGFLLGFNGFACFSFVLALTLPHLGTAASFAIGIAAATVVQLMFSLRADRRPRAAESAVV